jgi:hypothetical protein
LPFPPCSRGRQRLRSAPARHPSSFIYNQHRQHSRQPVRPHDLRHGCRTDCCHAACRVPGDSGVPRLRRPRPTSTFPLPRRMGSRRSPTADPPQDAPFQLVHFRLVRYAAVHCWLAFPYAKLGARGFRRPRRTSTLPGVHRPLRVGGFSSSCDHKFSYNSTEPLTLFNHRRDCRAV